MPSVYEYHTILEAIRHHAQNTPEKAALIDGKGVHTFSGVWEDIQHAARALRALQLQKGDRLVFECTQDEIFMAVNLACSLEGIIFVGVERRVAPLRLEEIAQQTTPSCIILRRENAALSLPHMSVETFLAGAGAAVTKNTPALPDPETVCEILFSTGTTGKSKGVMLTNRANLACAQNVVSGSHMESDAVELMPLPVNHAHGLRTVYAHLVNGSCCVIANGITLPRLLLDMMDRYRVNALDLTPSAAQMLLQTAGEKLHERERSIRYVVTGAAFLPETTKEALRTCFPHAHLYNSYGSSEAGRCCVLDFSVITGRPGCIGKPVPNAQFAVLGEGGRPIASDKDHTGLLACGGSMVMSGYWNEPRLTAQTLQNGYVVTADLAYMDEEGFVYVLGRQDDVINYKGVKISPEEIEEAACACELIADSVCVPVKDELAGQVPKLYVVIAPGRETDYTPEKLFAFLKERVEDNRMPRTIEVIEKVPRTYNGKVQRKKLME